MPSLVCTSSCEEGWSLKTPPRLKEEVSRSDGGDSVFNLPPLRSSLFAKEGQFFLFQSPSAMCNQSPSPFGYSLLGLRGRVFVWYSLKLLRFCKEEVSRSDGGDSANALFVFWADTSVRPYGWCCCFALL